METLKRHTVTQDMMLEAALNIIRRDGKAALSARRVAEEADCSTQPIFRMYKSMNALVDDLFIRCVDFFTEYFEESIKDGTDAPFVDFGIAYVSFAREEPNVFRILFLEENRVGISMYDILNGGKKGFVRNEIGKLKGLKREMAQNVFMKIWLFLHGMACMELGADFDLSEEDTRSMLRDVFSGFYGKL